MKSAVSGVIVLYQRWGAPSHQCARGVAGQPAHLAVFGVPHILFQQRPASEFRYRKTAERIRFYKPERSQLIRDALWNRR